MMARTRLVAGPDGDEVINFTAEEELARDAEELAWADGAPARAAEEVQKNRRNASRS